MFKRSKPKPTAYSAAEANAQALAILSAITIK